MLILREKLQEKDCEIERLKQELQQKSIVEEDKTDSLSDKKIINNITESGEAVKTEM